MVQQEQTDQLAIWEIGREVIDRARAFLHHAARVIIAKAKSREPFTTDDVMRMRMAVLVAGGDTQKAVDRLFTVRGTHGLYENTQFERCYRDVRVGTLISMFAPDLVREQVGKHLFGIARDVQPRWG